MADKFFMNKQHGRHMGGKEESAPPPAAGKSRRHAGGHGHDSGSEFIGPGSHGHGAHPSIHVHSHENGHTVHIMHPDGHHEKHEHEHGDAHGIAEHIHNHIGGGDSGQDHGEPDMDDLMSGDSGPSLG